MRQRRNSGRVNRPLGLLHAAAIRGARPNCTDRKPRGVPETSDSEAVRGRLYLALLCLGWGTAWATMRIALTEIPPFSMRVTSLLLGGLTLTALAKFQGRSLRLPNRRTVMHVCVASLFNIVGFGILTPFAQLAAATSRVAILVYTMPIWACLLARPILGERLTLTHAIGLALCMAGLVVLVYPLAFAGAPAGILLALGAAVSWAIGTIYLKWAQLEGDPIAATLWQLVIGLVVIAICLPIFEGSLQVGQAHLKPILALVFPLSEKRLG